METDTNSLPSNYAIDITPYGHSYRATEWFPRCSHVGDRFPHGVLPASVAWERFPQGRDPTLMVDLSAVNLIIKAAHCT